MQLIFSSDLHSLLSFFVVKSVGRVGWITQKHMTWTLETRVNILNIYPRPFFCHNKETLLGKRRCRGPVYKMGLQRNVIGSCPALFSEALHLHFMTAMSWQLMMMWGFPLAVNPSVGSVFMLTSVFIAWAQCPQAAPIPMLFCSNIHEY